MAWGKYGALTAFALGLAVLGPVAAPARAADQAVTLWEARGQYVRVVPRDGDAPNRHPATLSKSEIRSGLAQVKITLDGAEQTELFTPEQREFYGDQLAKALAKAGPDNDVLIASISLRKNFVGLREQKMTTTRVFMDQDGLNVIVGDALVEVPNDTNTFTKVDPRLVSYNDARRSGPVGDGKWTLQAGGPGVTIKRRDWVVVSAAAMAVPVPGTIESEQNIERQVKELQQQIQQLKPQAAPAPMPAPAPVQVAPSSIEDRLRTLDDLKRKGLLTPEEYQDKRRAIINSL